MIDRPIYIDIDGTLTESASGYGKAIPSRINLIRDLIESGQQIVIWSGNGTKYAKDFAATHHISGAVVIGKPECFVDDNPDIRPRDRMKHFSPEAWFNER